MMCVESYCRMLHEHAVKVVLGMIFLAFPASAQESSQAPNPVASIKSAGFSVKARTEQEKKEIQELLESRKNYVPGNCSPEWESEIQIWIKARDWFENPPCVLEFTDSLMYRHPVAVGYRETKPNASVSARSKTGDLAKMVANRCLSQIYEGIGTEKTGSYNALRGVRILYSERKTTESGAEAFVVVMVKVPDVKVLAKDVVTQVKSEGAGEKTAQKKSKGVVLTVEGRGKSKNSSRSHALRMAFVHALHNCVAGNEIKQKKEEILERLKKPLTVIPKYEILDEGEVQGKFVVKMKVWIKKSELASVFADLFPLAFSDAIPSDK